MTTTTHASSGHASAPAVLPAALATLAATVALTTLGTVASPEADAADPKWRELLVISGIAAVAVALVFGLAVHRLQRSPRAGGVGLALAATGLLSVLVFWAGITPALAVGGLLLGVAARRHGRGGPATAAVVVGALALAAYVAVYASDWLAQR